MFYKAFEDIGLANRCNSLPSWFEPRLFCYAHSSVEGTLGENCASESLI